MFLQDEINGGKIINRLIENRFLFDKQKGKFIKITAYGLRFLPKGNYKIIYTERNIDEVLDSMEAMMGERDKDREKTKKAFLKLNSIVKTMISNREDVSVCFVNYNEILLYPKVNINKINERYKS